MHHQNKLKKIVKGQGLRLSLIGIPIGIILAVIVSFLIVPSVLEGFSAGTYYADMLPTKAHFTPVVFIGTILFSLLTVWISCIKPAKIASKISPTEALNYTGKKVKNKRKTENLLMVESCIRWLGIMYLETKKRALLVFLSLFVGIITYLSVNTFTSSLGLENYLREYYPHDFEIVDLNSKSSDKLDKNIDEIKNIEGLHQ